MDAERAAAAGRASRPRPLLLVLLAVAVLAFFILRADAPIGPARPASGTGAPPRAGAEATIDPAALDIQLESLAQQRPAPVATARNPFRFETRAAAPAQEVSRAPAPEFVPPGNGLPPASTGPPPRPITVRFIGVLERPGETFAVFVDCTAGRRTPYAREGEILDGRYRLVKIGMESVVIEHLDGTGRTTLAQSGQECVR